jgi:hypothetical protein
LLKILVAKLQYLLFSFTGFAANSFRHLYNNNSIQLVYETMKNVVQVMDNHNCIYTFAAKERLWRTFAILQIIHAYHYTNSFGPFFCQLICRYSK